MIGNTVKSLRPSCTAQLTPAIKNALTDSMTDVANETIRMFVENNHSYTRGAFIGNQVFHFLINKDRLIMQELNYDSTQNAYLAMISTSMHHLSYLRVNGVLFDFKEASTDHYSYFISLNQETLEYDIFLVFADYLCLASSILKK